MTKRKFHGGSGVSGYKPRRTSFLSPEALALGRAGLRAARDAAYSTVSLKALARARQIVSGSATQTQQSRIKHGRIFNEGQGGQYSEYIGPKGKNFCNKAIYDNAARQIHTGNGVVRLASTIGIQKSNSGLNLVTPSDVTTYTGDKFTRCFIDRSFGRYTMQNVMLSNCTVTIYDIMCRKDLPVSAVSNPVSAWAQGNIDEGVSGNENVIGATPWSCELFNEYYKVVQKTEVTLGAGQIHSHFIKMYPRKMFSSAYAQYTSAGGFKDQTYFCMITVRGQPANDVTTHNSVSIGQAALNVVLEFEVEVRQLQKSTPTIVTSNGLATTLAGGEETVNVGGTTIVTDTLG